MTLDWTDSGAFSGNFLPAFAAAYHKAHENISINYKNLQGADYGRVVQLAFQSGDTPDIFRLVAALGTPAQAVSQKLVRPIDDLVPSFDTWKTAFPKGSFIEGLNVFDGKTYSFPMLGYYTWVLMFNQKYAEKAGVDPNSQPLTFDTFRAAAKKITQQGGGEHYGFVMDGAVTTRWGLLVSILGQLAHADGGEFNFKTGTYNYTSDGFAQVIDMILAMKSDKSIDPGSVSLSTEQARGMLAAGKGGMMLTETGVVPSWIAKYPDFRFNIGRLPVPSTTDHGYIGSAPQTSYFWVSAKTPQSELPVVGDIFSYLGSETGQETWQQVSGAPLPAIMPTANDVKGIDARLRYAYQYFQDAVRTLPVPEARNPDVSMVLQEKKPVTPDLGTLMQGIYTGQVGDPKSALADLQTKSEKELDRAIAAAKAKGAKVSREDWVFGDWDPSKNYAH